MEQNIEQQSIPLTQVPTDMNVTVCGLDNKDGIRSRLCALGITPGSQLTICGANRCILVKGTSLQLCETMQECIHCKPCKTHECCTCRKK